MDVSSCGVMGPRRSLSGDEVGTAISERTCWRSHRGKQSSPLHMLAPVHLRVCVCVCVGVLGRSSKPGGKKKSGRIIVVRSNYLNLPCVVLQ
jgi:hypothetical protein